MNQIAGTMEDQMSPDTDQDTPLRKMIEAVNIAEDLTELELTGIGADCKTGFDKDLESRREWEHCLDEWTKLAMQVREPKTWPWVNASNVKYPLLSTASMQFNARAYPSLIPSDGKVVKGRVIGKDPTGAKTDKADRISTYMSYQFMYDMPTWNEDMDRMLIILPIIGTVFKKTSWCSAEKKIKSELVLPKQLVINNWAKSVEEAERVSEIILLPQRIFTERKRQGLFLDVELGEPVMPTDNLSLRSTNHYMMVPATDETTPYEFVEQHTYLDLDKDGYPEPYIVTFLRSSGKVVRIVARFEPKNIEVDDKNEIVRITPTQYYTKFSFVPNPDGSFYDIGFGVLLGPINEAVNTLVNQLVDAGTINNLQSGFIGKGLRLKMGENKFSPGEWKAVNATGDDLKKQIVLLPSKEPSSVLFQLMGSLITSGKELASVAEIFVGKMPGQNTPATTTMATIEQGMKVFTAVYKRIYRSLEKEFQKVYDLNGVYLNPNTYQDVLDTPIGPEDFSNEHYDICPGADPTAVSQTEKLLKAQGLMELMSFAPGALNPIEIISRVLQAQEQPNWEQLFTQEVQQSGQIPSPPDPKQMELQMKSQADQQRFAMEQQNQAFTQQLNERDQVFNHQMQSAKQDQDARHEQVMTAIQAASTLHMDQARVKGEAMKNAQKLVQSDQQHQQKMTQMKETQKLSRQATSKAGSPAK